MTNAGASQTRQYQPFGHFRDDAQWNDDRLAVEFTLDFRTGDREIQCRVCWAALQDAAHDRGEIDGKKALQFYKRFKAKIHAAVDRKLKISNFDQVGFITIDTYDMKG